MNVPKLFSLSLSNLKQKFKEFNSINDIAETYGLEKIVSSFFIVFDLDHPEYGFKVQNLEMELGASDILYNLPENGHSFTSENFQDRLYLFEYEVSEEEIKVLVGNVAVIIERIDYNLLID
jgi:hypothetical protein|tara:strand:- start:388 stop:750 length:363 start_codon:yes stop_codon:yes gene_type:complete